MDNAIGYFLAALDALGFRQEADRKVFSNEPNEGKEV